MSSLHKFFVPQEQIIGNRLTLTGSDVSHIRTVLRLKAGDSIQVISDSDKWHTVRLVEVKAKEIHGEVIASETIDVESPLEVHLGQALTKANKFDVILRKSVELGVRSVAPLITERCVVKIQPTESEKKIGRWKKIALESSKQCGRSRVPTVAEDIATLEYFCRENDDKDLKLVFWEMEEKKFLKNLKLEVEPRSVAVLIGPEGGFSQTEIEMVRGYGFQTISLGPRILRAETAPVVALALLQSFWGDL
ncbi:MAG: 16S rRNA (uracil(1498)-N(3))-methyltransferase [Nitrospina sp.]|jgi:16S rRNA (uracil1498-N3)-methyltransferase|nr:16S rRNA (uracil(1498)-N(3))-methyltransferase [Nitrospina sp.]MBT6716799.1 16S rRNA (uracil(1498)-N(3))-methyltransferase [Nitrospina sp.]